MIFICSVGQNKEVGLLLDSTIKIMKINSVNSKLVDWEKIKDSAFKAAKGINDPYQLGSVIRYLYQSVDDFHGAFYYKDSIFQWQKFKNPVSDSIMNEWRKGPRIRTNLFGDQIAYLRIPSILAGSIEEFSQKAQALNDSLCILLNKSPKGLILDLRLNGGGAMHPMILGVQNLLPSGKVGEFHTNRKEDWILEDNKFTVDTLVLATIVPKCMINAQGLPIVILTSSQTASSGEFLIMTFMGRPRTVLLGERTAGYVTVNNGYQVSDYAFMNLAIGYGADRQGLLYKEAIKPSILVVGPDSFNNLENDLKVQEAIRWLKQQ